MIINLFYSFVVISKNVFAIDLPFVCAVLGDVRGLLSVTYHVLGKVSTNLYDWFNFNQYTSFETDGN